ncbi:MAG TPA: type II toxin-antitoxin system PemK/MazF family toxin [Phototrophicaceae bacterium]|nr:type II toxin-antitoxin system PemK/MazF family toxin [Phototrophicaceae bacterium]
MGTTIKTTLSISTPLFNQAETLAQQLNLAPEQLVELALEQFIRNHQHQQPLTDINQGDVYWVQPDPFSGLTSAIPHPQVVIQENVLNHSRLQTVVVCALTSNLQRASLPGNILIETGEANLPKASIVEVSKVAAVAKAQLGEYIGTLNAARIQQILAGMRFLQTSFFER